MAKNNQQIVSHNNQQQPDYADLLEPGYRFCPTDPELIVYYLKPKIETGKRHPNCRYYEVNIYDYSHDELTAKPEYRSCENKWYFLTWTEHKHCNGNCLNRQTRNGGNWKASQACAAVKDVTNRVVGSRLSLAYFDENKHKTRWLMHEYTTKNPNIPKESRKHNTDKNKLTDWVLCKIYKKVPKQKYPSNNLADQEEVIVETNHRSEDEPSHRRRRLSMDQESYQSNGDEHVHIRESNHQSGTGVHIVAPVQIMLTSNQQSDVNNVHVESPQTFPSMSINMSLNSIPMQHMPMLCGSNLIQPPFEDPQALFSKEQVQPSFEEDVTGHDAQLDDNMTCPGQAPAVQLDTSLNPMTFSHTLTDDVFQQDFQNSYHDTPSLYEEPTMVPEAGYSSYNPDSLVGLENFESFDPSSEYFSIDDFMDAPMDE
ncbi:NAC domain-containing protein [Artemisia annua]|uniref:NAC domain-containing protein n=1 Tax=Artemisia annua TaxID=35608 RepID=A0A2U1LNB3_ARTAN|nr:NAC domain-containing protein [Artemisia annua]